MREVGVDGSFRAPFGIPSTDFDVYSHCERRLLDIELDLCNSASTFEAVQWAISELQRMELEDRYSVPASHQDEDQSDAASLARSSSKEQGGGDGTVVEELPSIYVRGSQDNAALTWGRLQSEDQIADEESNKRSLNKDESPSGLEHEAEKLVKREVRNWRHMFIANSKRKSSDEHSGSDGGKKAKVSELSSVEELVLEADHGEAGKRMAERISVRLAIPDCIHLTNLVSHCLLVSMDQVPTKRAREALASSRLDVVDAAHSREGIGSKVDRHAQSSSDSNDWLWLHKWLVKSVLSDSGGESGFASLDWLVAFMTAARQSLIKPILDDLASDLQTQEIRGSVSLASYMRRTGVLEYAALRDSERIFGSLRPLFPPAVFPFSETEAVSLDGNELWHGWLGLMILCPTVLSAFCRFWIPTLSAEAMQSWRIKFAPTSLSAIWTPLVEHYTEAPRTTSEWLYAASLRRLPELAPVASDIVVLLSGLNVASTDDGTSKGILGFGNSLLNLIYRRISKHVLPKVLGGDQGFRTELLPDRERSREETGANMFMETLKQHSHVLWNKALEKYSTSNCTCCEIPRKEEVQHESSAKTKSGPEGGVCVESSEEGSALKGYQGGSEVQNGCLYNDPLIQLCHLTLLCCKDQVVAHLLANASLVQPSSVGSFHTQSLRRLVMVMRALWFASGQGRGTHILELWSQQVIDHAVAASDEQVLQNILAMRQLLDLDFWKRCCTLLGSSSQSSLAIPTVASEDAGLSWKILWRGLRKVMDVQWLHILRLMHREGAWELRLAVLRVLQLLNQDGTTRPQAVADRLKGVLGLFFSWLEVYDGCNEVRQADNATLTSESGWKWQCACAKEHLKSIIVELASSSFPSFTLMINSLLDFSFERSTQMYSSLSPSSTGQLSRTELSGILVRKAGTGSPSLFSMAPLSTGKLNRYGRLELLSVPASEQGSSLESWLIAENRRIQADASSSLLMYNKERVGVPSQLTNSIGKNAGSVSASEYFDKDLTRSKVFDAELGSLLHRTLQRAIARSVELLDEWPCHPVNVLATHMADRLETPHEVPMTMEQYEEVLPRHVTSRRHMFLTDCFSQNPLLIEMVELIVRHGGNRAVLRCVEFVRVLLADSISRWHGAFGTRVPQSLAETKVGEVEAWNRVQVSRLVQLVASANWLPQPLAASGEMVAVIDGADIADLLLLVWRCMHHAMAFGPKAWEESSSNLHTGVPEEGQPMTTTGSVADEEAGKEGSYKEWENHFLAILRRNISNIGAHFPQVYPMRRAF